jgi:hypothetical protein
LTTAVVRLTVGIERSHRWRDAAALTGESLDKWALHTLDKAAASAFRQTERTTAVAGRMYRRRDTSRPRRPSSV